MKSSICVTLKDVEPKRGAKLRKWAQNLSTVKSRLEATIKDRSLPELSKMFNDCDGMCDYMYSQGFREGTSPFASGTPYIRCKYSRTWKTLEIIATTGVSDYNPNEQEFEKLITELQELTDCLDLELMGAVYWRQPYPYKKGSFLDFDIDKYTVRKLFKKGYINTPYL